MKSTLCGCAPRKGDSPAAEYQPVADLLIAQGANKLAGELAICDDVSASRSVRRPEGDARHNCAKIQVSTNPSDETTRHNHRVLRSARVGLLAGG